MGKSKDLVVGLFVLAGIAFTAFTVFLLGDEKRLFEREETYNGSDSDEDRKQVEYYAVSEREFTNIRIQAIKCRDAPHTSKLFSPVRTIFVGHDPARRKLAIAVSTRSRAKRIVALNRNFSAPRRL